MAGPGNGRPVWQEQREWGEWGVEARRVGEHTGRGSGAALAVLSVPHKQEGAVADSVCWQNHYLAGTDDGWVCTAKPVRDYYRH